MKPVKNLSETKPATVFVVDDDPAMCDSLRWVLEIAGFKVKTYLSAEAFLEDPHQDRPGCLVLDIRMPGINGLQLQELLLEKSNSLPIIFISAHGEIPDAVSALRKGAVDFLPKPFDNQILLERIQSSVKLDQERQETRRRYEELMKRVARLTRRERQILDLLVVGKMNKIIAADLEISIKTVEAHRAQVMEKTKTRNLAELIHLMNFLQDSQSSSADPVLREKAG